MDLRRNTYFALIALLLIFAAALTAQSLPAAPARMDSARPSALALHVLSTAQPPPTPQAVGKSVVSPATAATSSTGPAVITLADALHMARANSVDFQTAVAAAGTAQQNKAQARAGLLPSLNYNNQFLYTEGNGTSTGRFIGANGVHEYLSQGDAHELLGLSPAADYQRSSAEAARARALAEVARRGLVVTVVNAYYSLAAAEREYVTAQQAAQQAADFLRITQALQRGGEVANADVIKATLQSNAAERALLDAKLAMQQARVALAVLIYPDFNLNFTVVDDMIAPPLPSLDEITAEARDHNPTLAAALQALRAARAQTLSARGEYLPNLSLDYFYGIDANQFAAHAPNGMRNLGYAATATLNVPVWNWGATHSKVKQGVIQEQLAQVELNAAQKAVLGNLQTLYAEAATARAALESLRQSAALADESLRLARMRYQAGETTILEVVDAQNTFAAAHNAFDQGELRYRVALANLQTLTGTM